MTLEETYRNCEIYLNKTNNGGMFGPKEFNYLLESITPDFFKKEAEDVMRKFGSLPKGLYSSKLLREFRKEEDVTPAAGVIDLTALASTYVYFISAITTAENDDRYVKAVLVNDDQWETISTAYIGKPTADYIICRIVGDNMEIKPTTTGEINLTYLTFPATPVLDYYIDADDNIVFMVAGALNVAIPAGGTASDGTAGATTKNSATVELEFSEDYHYQFMLALLSALGARIDNGMLVNYTNTEEQKIKQI